MKKVLTVSFYADFSRFFHLCEKSLSIKASFKNLCLYPSAYIYSKMHGQDAEYLPASIRKIGTIKVVEVSESDLEYVCGYYDKPENYFEVAKMYINYFEMYLIENKFDLIILSGDSRLAIRALKIVASRSETPLLYFEQGPYGTTILDPEGVNANCSFRSSKLTLKNSDLKNEIINSTSKKWLGYKKYRVIDYILYKFGFSYPEQDNLETKKKNTLSLEVGKVQLPCIVLILQVPLDANMKCHSPHFSNHFEIISEVYMNLPSGYRLIVREHPLHKGYYESDLYEFINDNKIYLSRKESLNELIEMSDLVVINNSTVGVEALILEKPILVLGDSYYDNDFFIHKYDGVDLKVSLLAALANNKCSQEIINERLNYLFAECFIPEHFRNEKVGKATSKRIEKYL